MSWVKDAKVYSMHKASHDLVKIGFPTLEHFIEDVIQARIKTVRLDLFQEARPSELSFVHYITPTLYVTAHDTSAKMLYEYVEPTETRVSTETTITDSSLLDSARERCQNIQARLSHAGLTVRHGRYCISSAAPARAGIEE